MADMIVVQVCYATPQKQFLRDMPVPQGATVQQAIAQSGVLQTFPEIDLQHTRVGIHGKLKALDTVLREHDRIELYRLLVADPKESRRMRVGDRRKG